jgi:hypothetical protein
LAAKSLASSCCLATDDGQTGRSPREKRIGNTRPPLVLGSALVCLESLDLSQLCTYFSAKIHKLSTCYVNKKYKTYYRISQ